MSLQHHRPDRHECRACASRRARFRYRGEVRADRDHNLCFQPFRAETNRQRARRLLEDVARPVKPARSRDLIACA